MRLHVTCHNYPARLTGVVPVWLYLMSYWNQVDIVSDVPSEAVLNLFPEIPWEKVWSGDFDQTQGEKWAAELLALATQLPSWSDDVLQKWCLSSPSYLSGDCLSGNAILPLANKAEMLTHISLFLSGKCTLDDSMASMSGSVLKSTPLAQATVRYLDLSFLALMGHFHVVTNSYDLSTMTIDLLPSLKEKVMHEGTWHPEFLIFVDKVACEEGLQLQLSLELSKNTQLELHASTLGLKISENVGSGTLFTT